MSSEPHKHTPIHSKHSNYVYVYYLSFNTDSRTPVHIDTS